MVVERYFIGGKTFHYQVGNIKEFQGVISFIGIPETYDEILEEIRRVFELTKHEYPDIKLQIFTKL